VTTSGTKSKTTKCPGVGPPKGGNPELDGEDHQICQK